VLLVAVGAALLVAVRAPERTPAPSALRGHRVFRLSPGGVGAVEVEAAGRRFRARRVPTGWLLDDGPADQRTAAALDDLLDTLVGLRAVDVFRPRDTASYGLDRPEATITVHTGRRVRRVVLGAPNAAGSAFYARRDHDPRVMQVGSMLLSAIERVLSSNGERVAE
jgi:hypothetical protein